MVLRGAYDAMVSIPNLTINQHEMIEKGKIEEQRAKTAAG
jgi:hypothetical protein